jgi:signal transduction histidine kinase
MIIDPGMDEPARRSAFASMVAHELRTPLTAVYGALEMMTRGKVPLDAERTAVLVELAQRNAARLLRIVEDCLDLEAASDGRLYLDRTIVDPAEIVALGVAGAESAREQTGANVVVRLDARRNFVGDRVRLGRALAHLVQNAVTFAPPGSPVVVSTMDDPGRGAVRFSVENHGPGIEPHELQELFKQFDVREAIGRRRVGGLGVGLALVRTIAEQHAGAAGADSVKGHTTFWLELPARSSNAA